MSSIQLLFDKNSNFFQEVFLPFICFFDCWILVLNLPLKVSCWILHLWLPWIVLVLNGMLKWWAFLILMLKLININNAMLIVSVFLYRLHDCSFWCNRNKWWHDSVLRMVQTFKVFDGTDPLIVFSGQQEYILAVAQLCRNEGKNLSK